MSKNPTKCEVLIKQHLRPILDISAMLRPGMCTSSVFNTQHVAIRRKRVAKRTQHVAPNNVAILWSFGRGLGI